MLIWYQFYVLKLHFLTLHESYQRTLIDVLEPKAFLLGWWEGERGGGSEERRGHVKDADFSTMFVIIV